MSHLRLHLRPSLLLGERSQYITGSVPRKMCLPRRPWRPALRAVLTAPQSTCQSGSCLSSTVTGLLSMRSRVHAKGTVRWSCGSSVAGAGERVSPATCWCLQDLLGPVLHVLHLPSSDGVKLGLPAWVTNGFQGQQVPCVLKSSF